MVVEQSVNHGDKGALGEFLVDQVLVESGQHFAGRNQAILLTKHFLGADTLFNINRQQTRGYAMSHGIGDIKTNMPFIQSEHIVKVAADPATELIMHGKLSMRDGG